MSADSWSNRLYHAVRNYLLPWPVRDTYVRIAPVATDDDVEFYSDIRYFEDLAEAILSDIHLARHEAPDMFVEHIGLPLLQLAAIPVESQTFWDQWDWPDKAADLLSLWRFDRELNAWMAGDEILAEDEAA